MTANRLIRMLCKYLRYRPQELGLQVQRKSKGFDISNIVVALRSKSIFLSIDQLMSIIINDPHRRLVMNDYHVSPSYGRNSANLFDLMKTEKCLPYFGYLWFPSKLSRLTYLQHHLFSRPDRKIPVYIEPNDASTKAACYRRHDTPIILKLDVQQALVVTKKTGKGFLAYITPQHIAEVRKVVPALGHTWEESKAANLWSYSIIYADKQKK